MTDTPSLALVIPMYNCEAYVAEALRSVAAQTLQPDRVVLVDDGSSDRSVAVATAVSKQCGLPLTLRSQRNRGAASARNLGVRTGDEELVAFMDADDTLYPSFLELTVRALVRYPELQLCFSDRDVVTGTGEFIRRDLDHAGFREIASTRLEHKLSVLSGDVFIKLIPGSTIPMAFTVRRSAFDGVGGFDDELRAAEDQSFLMRMALKGALGFWDEPLGTWRRHDANTSSPRNAYDMAFYEDLVLSKFADTADELRLGARMLEAIHTQQKHSAARILYESSHDGRTDFFRLVRDLVRAHRVPWGQLPKAVLRWGWRQIAARNIQCGARTTRP